MTGEVVWITGRGVLVVSCLKNRSLWLQKKGPFVTLAPNNISQSHLVIAASYYSYSSNGVFGDAVLTVQKKDELVCERGLLTLKALLQPNTGCWALEEVRAGEQY